METQLKDTTGDLFSHILVTDTGGAAGAQSVCEDELFRQCRQILDRRCEPVHYVDLTRLALGEMLGECRADLSALTTAVRLAARGETFYTGDDVQPCHSIGLAKWLIAEESRLVPCANDIVNIPPNYEYALTSTVNTVARMPHIIDKFGLGVERHTRQVARGFLHEEHVAGWFRNRWPTLFHAPENPHNAKAPCAHDFRLEINGEMVKFDVAPNARTKPPRKPDTDYHIFVEQKWMECAGRSDLNMMSWCPGNEWSEGKHPARKFPMWALFVRLNAEVNSWSLQDWRKPQTNQAQPAA